MKIHKCVCLQNLRVFIAITMAFTHQTTTAGLEENMSGLLLEFAKDSRCSVGGKFFADFIHSLINYLCQPCADHFRGKVLIKSKLMLQCLYVGAVRN